MTWKKKLKIPHSYKHLVSNNNNYGYYAKFEFCPHYLPNMNTLPHHLADCLAFYIHDMSHVIAKKLAKCQTTITTKEQGFAKHVSQNDSDLGNV